MTSPRAGRSELSGGQRQRVGVARALAADPPILLMDEPFGALDPVTRSELHDEFRRIQSAVRKTIVIVTHDMAEALSLATQDRRARRRRAGRARPAGRDRDERATPRVRGDARAAGRSDHGTTGPGARVRVIEFWASHQAEFGALLLQHLFLVAVSTVVAVVIGVPLGILAARRPRARRADRVARQRRADGAEPGDVRLPAAAAVRRRPRRARRDHRAHRLRAAADRPHHDRRHSLRRPGPRRSRHGARHDAAAVAPSGPVAARAAVDRRRDPRRRRDRRRYGDDCRGGRRRRPRRVHLPRPVDGRSDRHPRGRHSVGGPGADPRRRADARGTRDPLAAQWRPAHAGRGFRRRLRAWRWPWPRGRSSPALRSETPIRVGSKNFTEQILLGELLAQTIEARGHRRSSDGSISAARSSAIARSAPATSTSTSSTRARR